MNVGIDIVSVERVRKLIARFPAAESRLFTPEERRYCRGSADPAQSFAGTLAAKEAVIKAAGLGPLAAWAARVEIERGQDGRPFASITGSDHVARASCLPVSISHDGGIAAATATFVGSRGETDPLGPWGERT